MKSNQLRNWLKIRSNQAGIFFAVVHWFVLSLTLYIAVSRGADPREGNSLLNEGSSFVAIIILICDLPAIIIPLIFWSLLYFFENRSGFVWGICLTSIFTITYQWIVVGRRVYHLHTPIKINLSIIDD